MDFSQGVPVWVSITIYVLLVWTLLWRGLALWRAAKYDQRNWFVVILVLTLFFNTVGILEIVYLFRFAKKRMTIAEIKTWLKSLSKAEKK